MKKIVILLLGIFYFTNSYTQIVTERSKVFFQTLKTAGDPLSFCNANEESRSTLLAPTPTSYMEVKFNSTPIRLDSYDGVDVSVLSKEEAQKLFDRFKELAYIPTKYLEDGCYARAHELALIAKNNGVILGKAFLVPNAATTLLYPKNISESKIDRDRFHRNFNGWKYHVNAFVLVQNGDKVEPFVFDLGISENIQNFNEWENNLVYAANKSRIIVKSADMIFHDTSFSSPDLSIIDSLVETQKVIDELGMDEYLLRLERGWL